ncbi:short-chain dehydrogenase TIC 32 [Podospora aff. communis PSN243]|uniref:Short-chain dehydrogenase TIC 32 n=1 Tax=Podospora aff. communis PSN243 TaxID=3040156 RepID=A0AAV9GAR3_9PEZI|nr:short-chain dehydrogenase TIC 32 [Podospora aff. communis PSN243]
MPPPYTSKTTASELATDFAPHITSKTILTTGVSPGGLGAAFITAIARASPALLILAGRSPSKVSETAATIHKLYPDVRTRVLELDLGSLESVRRAAEEVISWTDVPVIDVLVNNAGIMAVEYGLSPEGVERHFATNHLGHFLLTNLVMGKILAAGEPRVVCVSSDGHRLGGVRWDDLNFDVSETYNKWVAYGQSKTANMLFAVSLAEKLGGRGLLAFSLHPGVIATNLGGHLDWQEDFGELKALDQAQGNKEGWAEFKFKTPDQGAATSVFAAFSPDLKGHNGAYLQDCHVADPWIETVKAWATSPVEAERLWKLSEKLIGEEFHYRQ